MIGILAIMLVTGYEGGKLADPTGALAIVARNPFGSILLIVFMIGAIGHGAWNLLRAAADVDGVGGGWQGVAKRTIQAGAGIFYLGLAWTASSVLLSLPANLENGREPETLTAILLAVPLGSILVFLIGIGVIGAGVHECFRGLTGKYQENYRTWEIKGIQMTFITFLGVLGFTARAVILVLIGWFFLTAAVYYNPDEAGGIDQALAALAQTEWGRIFVFAASTGLACHGILSFYEASYRKIC
ncbi:MAG: DUF1206 domain-containing protein [Acidobacteria bacterium]|nr:DUF1206 domain-containing protein [Acidobacteriota bacterium]